MRGKGEGKQLGERGERVRENGKGNRMTRKSEGGRLREKGKEKEYKGKE